MILCGIVVNFFCFKVIIRFCFGLFWGWGGGFGSRLFFVCFRLLVMERFRVRLGVFFVGGDRLGIRLFVLVYLEGFFFGRGMSFGFLGLEGFRGWREYILG